MAEIIQNEGVPQRGKQRARKQPAHIDMTPMVDLACLLLTFFMLTTAFIKPKVLEIVLPSITGEPQPIKEKRVLNIVLAENDQVFLYNGKADPAENNLPVMIKSNFTEKGLRKVLLEGNRDLYQKIKEYNESIERGIGFFRDIPKDSVIRHIKKLKAADKAGPIVLIKAAEGVKYGRVVDVLDEMAITGIARYSLVNINEVEKKMLKDALSGKNVEIQ